jgi:hypothetical protein
MPLKFRLPKDIPMSEYPKPEAYLEEGLHLTDEAQKQGSTRDGANRTSLLLPGVCGTL